jgi:hypothetical protein
VRVAWDFSAENQRALVAVRRLKSICGDFGFGCSRQLRAAFTVATPPGPVPSVAQWMMTMLYLADAEIADLCAPLTQTATQVRHLRTRGLMASATSIGVGLCATDTLI